MSMTIESLDKLEALKAKATPGDWVHMLDKSWPKPDRIIGVAPNPACKADVENGFGFVIIRNEDCERFGDRGDAENYEFIAALRNSASDLISLAREALEKREKVQIAVPRGVFTDCTCGAGLYHSGNDETDKFCPGCGKEIEWKS